MSVSLLMLEDAFDKVDAVLVFCSSSMVSSLATAGRVGRITASLACIDENKGIQN